MPYIPLEAGSFYIFDRGYNDFLNLARINAIGSFFVVRAKRNLSFRHISWKRRLPEGIMSDSIVELKLDKSRKLYPDRLRRVMYYDSDNDVEYVYITNAMDISSLEVANLYRNRWNVELFFKWVKQHLKIKKFWGTSENAVRIQVYCAIISYCLIAIVQHDMRLDRSIYETLQIIGVSLTDKTNLKELFDKTNIVDKIENCNYIEQDLFSSLGFKV